MKNKIVLAGMELHYLFRQKFLWSLLLLGIVFTIWRMPRFVCDYLNYDVFDEYNLTHSFEKMNEVGKLNVDYWNTKKAEVESQKKILSERASIEKKRLTERERFEREYLTAVEKSYGKPLSLEVQDYSGWELFFLFQTSMAPHSPIAVLEIIMIAGAGLLLLTKDKENQTLFWASVTGRGTAFSVYFLKLLTILLYGLFIQFVFHAVHILWLWLVNRMDMRHLFHLIQNIPQFGMCDLQITICETIFIDAVLKCVLALLLVIFVLLFVPVLKKYFCLLLGAAGIAGILYALLYSMCEVKNFGIGWRVNPFSIFQLERVLRYDAINIGNHAVDLRIVTGGVWFCCLFLLTVGAYQVWRKYLHVYSS